LQLLERAKKVCLFIIHTLSILILNKKAKIK
jgi:hypothetical protein